MDANSNVQNLFRNANVVAPMVRVGTLPFRQLCLESGADLVYGEELIDLGFVRTNRRVRKNRNGLDIVEYVQDRKRVLFSTFAEHSNRLVFQMGTSNAATALRAAQHVIDDVVGVDVNMGCPKSFSVQGGMGVALMDAPERVVDILRTLRGNLPASKSVTCKIRIFDNAQRTLDFCRMVEGCGITALAVHGRTRDQRDPDPANWNMIKLICETVTSIPIILNGDVFQFQDFARAREATGCSSVMTARGAIANCDIFCDPATKATRSIRRQCSDYIDRCIEYDAHFVNCKYVLQRMLGGVSRKDNRELTAQVTTAKDFSAVASIFPKEAVELESATKKHKIDE